MKNIKPSFGRLVIIPDPPKEQTESGIYHANPKQTLGDVWTGVIESICPRSSLEDYSERVVGQYTDWFRQDDMDKPYLSQTKTLFTVGDRVLYGTYAGASIELEDAEDGKSRRIILFERDVIGIVE